MSDNSTKADGRRPVGRAGGGSAETIDEVAAGGFDPSPDIDVGNTPSSPELSKPRSSFEVGGENDCDCDGAPELTIDKGVIGPRRFQVLYCSECMHQFGVASEVANDDDEEDETDG